MTEDDVAKDTGRRDLIRAIRELPEADPPPGFSDGVLRRLAPKRLCWWRRAWFWARSPKSLVVTPLRVAGLGLVAAGLLMALTPMLKPPGTLQADASHAAVSTVTFHLPDPQGRIRSAAVIGSFNRWNPKGFQMRFVPDRGLWLLQARLPAGSHEYVFLLNETQVLPDPGTTLTREDGFGNTNSVLLLTEGDEQTI